MKSPPLKRVLLATDLSPQATLALGRVALLPLALGARLQLLHVLPSSRLRAGAHVPPQLRKQLLAEVQRLDGMLMKRGIHDSDLVFKVAHGDPFEEILKHARTMRAELIVLGRHGTGGASTMLLGSTAERVVRGKVAPVLVVTREPEQPYARPMVAIAPNLEVANPLLESALQLLPPDVSRVEFVSAYDAALESWIRAEDLSATSIARLRKKAATEAHDALTRQVTRVSDRAKTRAHIFVGDPRAMILRVIDRRGSDLVVLGTHARRGLARFLLGSVAVEVLRSARIDVLIVPTKSLAR